MKNKLTNIECVLKELKQDYPIDVYFDTETTGLDLIKDVPFLATIGWNEKVFAISKIDLTTPMFLEILHFKSIKNLWIWNAKYDCHMLYNLGITDLPWNKIKDGISVVVLSGYVDKTYPKLGLKAVVGDYDSEANLLEQKVKKELAELLRIHKRKMFNYKNYSHTKIKAFLVNVDNDLTDLPIEVQNEWKKYHTVSEPNYTNVNRDLMIEYAKKDIVLMRDYIKMKIEVIKERKQMHILEFENKALEPFFMQERLGMKIDTKYVLNSVKNLKIKIRSTRQKLYECLKEKINVNQHAKLKEKINQHFNLKLKSVDKQTITEILLKHHNGTVRLIGEIILNLRSLEKWYSTYGVRTLNGVDENNIFRASFHLFKAITSRITSNFHQFPNKELYDLEDNEIFNPRKMVIPFNSEFPYIVYFDYSEMELRLQAEYTINYNKPDEVLISAYLPWNQDKKNWKPLDVHQKTADLLFNEKKELHRKFGKSINFAVIYGGGVKTIYQFLRNAKDIETPSYLQIYDFYNTYKNLYKGISYYQKVVRENVLLYKNVSTLYGRKYFFKSPSQSVYKAYNYLIQGCGAYLLKIKVIYLYHWLKKNNYKSFIFLTVHDEILFSIAKGEGMVLYKIKEILEKTQFTVPMKVGVSATKTNWSEKVNIEI